MNKNRIFIFDTTLRDGQQSPGAGMSFEDNLRYADYAEALRVDVLEVGFPAASQLDFKIVSTIAEKMAAKNSALRIAALCQLREEQVIKTMEALAPARAIHKARVHTYVPVAPDLMKASLGPLAAQPHALIERVYQLILLATQEGYEVEFSAESYSRMGDNFDFTTDLIRAAVSAGATVINCPDTLGAAASIEGEHYFVHKMREQAKIIEREFPDKQITWSVHCHNDLGLALENSLQGVFQGPARQVEGCLNGVGERAGNMALEQFVLYVALFGAKADPEMPYFTQVQTEYLKQASDFIAAKMLPRQPHFPLVGDNAAKHSSGGHTNAILKNPLAYQPFDPKVVGGQITFLFGPLSGSHHARNIIDQYGYSCDENEKVQIAQFIKNYYVDRRKGITEEELIKAYKEYRKPIQVSSINCVKEEGNWVVVLNGSFFGKKGEHSFSDEGGRSVLSVLELAVIKSGFLIKIEHRQNQSVVLSQGSEPVSKSTVVISEEQQGVFTGIASDKDLELSELKALIEAVNQAYIERYYRVKEKEVVNESEKYH